jgi:hypothetical protein
MHLPQFRPCASPQKPNEIVNWIRKNYPAEWDGDEGRCSAHRVRTYLARKGADMYYEKLNQGCIAGWRIRQNHLWRFENGGFQGRGMKQEEAIAQAQKESEAIATAAHKAAAAEALAAGHPGIKVSMSQPGINDGTGIKRQRLTKGNGIARRKNTKAKIMEMAAAAAASITAGPAQGHNQNQGGLNTTLSGNGMTHDSSTFYHTTPHDFAQHAGPSNSQSDHAHHLHDNHIDPNLNDAQVDLHMVQQAMQAAAGQMDELEMGMQLPIEMQMHGGEHDDDFQFDVGDGVGGQHPYTPHGGQGFDGSQYGFTGQGGYGYGQGGQ